MLLRSVCRTDGSGRSTQTNKQILAIAQVTVAVTCPPARPSPNGSLPAFPSPPRLGSRGSGALPPLAFHTDVPRLLILWTEHGARHDLPNGWRCPMRRPGITPKVASSHEIRPSPASSLATRRRCAEDGDWEEQAWRAYGLDRRWWASPSAPIASGYSDHGLEMTGVNPASSFAPYDIVVIITDHGSLDRERLLREAKLVVDTRDALRGVPGDRSKIRML